MASVRKRVNTVAKRHMRELKNMIDEIDKHYPADSSGAHPTLYRAIRTKLVAASNALEDATAWLDAGIHKREEPA